MKCELCGAENSADSAFCVECGGKLENKEVETKGETKEEVNATPEVVETKEQVEATPEVVETKEPVVVNEETEKKSFNMMNIIKYGAGVLVVCVIAYFLIGFTSSSSDMSRNPTLVYEIEDSSYILPYNGEPIEVESELYNFDYSFDRSSFVYYDEEEEAIFVYSNGEVKEIEEDVYAYTISANGNAVAYATEYDDYVAELYVYDVKSEEKTMITRDAYMDYSYQDNDPNFVLSADGTRIGFAGDFDDDDYTFYGFTAVVGKDPEELDKYSMPIAISNNGNFVYYAKQDLDESYDDEKVFDVIVKTKKDENKILSDVTSFDLFFNRDLSQVLFYDDYKTYICIDGVEETKVDKNELSLVYNFNVPASYDYLGNWQYSFYQYGYEDLTDAIYYSGNTLYYINDEYDAQKICDDFSADQVSADGKSVLFLEDDKLNYIKDVTKPEDVIEYDLEDVIDFIASPSLDDIYYVNDDDELFYFNGSKSTKVGDEPEEMEMNEVTNTLYYISDEELYKVNKTKEEKISTPEDVEGVYTINEATFYYFEEDDETVYYRAIKDGEFEEVVK